MSRGVAVGSGESPGDDRGVSPVIGLVLLIGLVAVGSVSVVVIGGGQTTQLQDQATGEQAEATMAQLRDEVGSIVQGTEDGAGVSFPSVDDETVEVEDHSEIEITVFGSYANDSVGTCTYSSSLGSLRYGTSGDATLGYEANGIFRLQDGESVVVSPPNLQYRVTEIDGKRVRTLDVPVVDIQSGTGGAGGDNVVLSDGTNTAEVSLCGGQTPLAHVDNATIRIETTDFHDGWYDYAQTEFGGVGSVTIDHYPDAGSNGAGNVTIRNVDLGEVPPSEYEAEDFDPGEDGDEGEDEDDPYEDPYKNDLDQDGVKDGPDNCETVPNKNQADQDSDGVGDKCETIWAHDDTAGNYSVHEVNWVGAGSAVAGESLDSLTVDYPDTVADADATTVELDEIQESDVSVIVMNGNGTVYDRSSYGVDDVTTDSDDKTVTIDFSGDHEIGKNDTIRVKFADAKNPTAVGNYDVDITLNGGPDENGVLEIDQTADDDEDYGGMVYAEDPSPNVQTTHRVDWEGHSSPGTWTGNQDIEKIEVDYPDEVDVSDVEKEDVEVRASPGNSDDRIVDVTGVDISDGGSTLTISVESKNNLNLNPAVDINVSYEDAVNPDAGEYPTDVTMRGPEHPSSSGAPQEVSREDPLVIGNNPDPSDSNLPPNGDVDNDGVSNDVDNCERTPNPKQYDADDDGIGNECDNDNDNDGIPNSEDETPYPGMMDEDNTYVIDVSGSDVVLCDSGQSPEECTADSN